ncbi:hypothetical protein ACRFPS_11400, partial [Klebsiella pneumoniae]
YQELVRTFLRVRRYLPLTLSLYDKHPLTKKYHLTSKLSRAGEIFPFPEAAGNKSSRTHGG